MGAAESGANYTLGEDHVISAPVGSVFRSPEEFWEYYEASLREPVDITPVWAKLLGAGISVHEVKEDRGIFHTKTISSAGLAGLCLGADFKTKASVKIDRSSDVATSRTATMVGWSEEDTLTITTTRFVSLSMRLEMWTDQLEGRSVPEMLTERVKYTIKSALSFEDIDATGLEMAKAESPSGEGKVWLSSTLEGVVTPERTFACLARLCRGETAPAPLPDRTFVGLDSSCNAVFLHTAPQNGEKRHEVYTCDEEEQLFTIIIFQVGEVAAPEHKYRRVHIRAVREPFRLESWVWYLPCRVPSNLEQAAFLLERATINCGRAQG
eukprot:NODE_12938_length_1195_cov_6.006554.p1 GENE.NODE_12938_length_1195_cov_6.006554~~NODE_12938_length_1195_cov_6.006554.p1  ORF type:complete len:324 (+),score=73.21 NODE_12938_length_1195_cov_6.006554:132-1103(+)